jgi:hypothetical protein
MYIVISCFCISCGLRYRFWLDYSDVCVKRLGRLETRAEHFLRRVVDLQF